MYGKVVDVFIPAKRRKNGKRFGFVIFRGINYAEALCNKIKEIRFGEQCIFIKPALFQKPFANFTKRETALTGIKDPFV